MKIEQDKELQEHAFEIFKHKNLNIDEAYSDAKAFLDEKRNKDNLKIITSDIIKINAKTRIDYDKNVIVDFICINNYGFFIEGFSFLLYPNDDDNVNKIKEYVLDEVNKQIKIRGYITDSVEVLLHHNW